MTADSWLPGVPVLVRIEVRSAEDAVDRSLWDAEAALAARPAGVVLTPNKVVLRNGLGSALVTIQAAAGTAEIELDATVGDLRGTRMLRSLEGQPQTAVQGTLPEVMTVWSGIVHVTGALVVPPGYTLRVSPGTLVLVDGVTADAGGYSIDIRGTLECPGTAEQPITFTARDPARPWGEIHHDGAWPSLYQHTIMTRGGNSSRGGHTGTGPIVRATDSEVRFESCSFADTKGKTMTAADSDVAFYDCLFTRSVMGPEIGSTALLWERCWAQEMYGRDDNDGIYLHGQRAGQDLTLRGCVIASGDDDAIDTLRSEVTIEDCIVRDWRGGVDTDAKGISIYGGTVNIARCLVVDCQVGVAAKVQTETEECVVRIDRTTILGNEIAFMVFNKDGSGPATAKIYSYVSSSIVRAPDAIHTDYQPSDIHVSYSDCSEPWDGTGNIAGDPLFIDAAGKSFGLQASSPCIDTGDPAAAPDPDGTRADMGCFPYVHAADPLFMRGQANGDAAVDISDAVESLRHVFGSRPIACEDAADINDDGDLNVADAVYLLGYLFAGGPALPAPAGACGVDPTTDPLGCREHPRCQE